MAVLDRSDLEASPLADLHAIASQLGLDGYRRLRKEELIERILQRASGNGGEQDPESDAGVVAPSTRRRRAPRRRRSEDEPKEKEAEREAASPRRRQSRRRSEPEPAAPAEGDEAERLAAGGATVEGTIELLANGSAFLRPDEGSGMNEDVYVSAAQARRCELANGDRVSGPVRAARRSERHPSLVRIETLNGESADALAQRPRFDSLPAAFPTGRFALDSADATLKAIEWLTPFGRGSRVAIVGAAWAGKTETLRLLLGALATQQDLNVSLLLVGARPEEVRDWEQGPHAPVAALTLAAGPEAQGQTLERVIEEGRRLAARGEHALVAIDSLDGVPPHIARRALAAARNIVDGGSLTVIATASEPFGGETTVIALDALRTSTGSLPSLDLLASGTLKAELLVGEKSAAEILKARAKAAAALR